MFIPGRIEVLGKHTDYCGGRSIVCAVDRGFHASIEPRADRYVELSNLDTGENASLDLANPAAVASGHWTTYAGEVIRRLTSNFPERISHGCTIRFRSDLPKAAGQSSSSALMIMVFAALDAVNDLRSCDEFRENIYDDRDLAEYLGCIENGQSFRGLQGSAGVGTFGGSQDHAAILLGRTNTLSRFAFAPLRREGEFTFTNDLTFVVASSGVIAEKTGAARAKYNRVSRMISDITSALGPGSLASVIDERGIDEVRRAVKSGTRSFSGEELLGRLKQFYVENYEIIPRVSELLAAGHHEGIGELVDASQHNAERLLGNQVEETVFLQRSAREIGAIAASAFGAGFGGSVYAIVQTPEAERFRSEWQAGYVSRFSEHAITSEFFTTRPSQIVIT
ncbi:MAG: galactokinase family protein [Pyrinomonadaceae bacterium]